MNLEREIAVARFLADRMAADGQVTGQPGRLAAELGITFDQWHRAMLRLEQAGILTVILPSRGFRPAIWQLHATGAEAEAMIGALVPPDLQARSDLDREVQRRVSLRLLARLLKFHGRNPPDPEAAAAASRWRADFRRGAAT